MDSNRLKFLGFACLLLVLLALGWAMIPAHVTTIWMDCEFTDWTTPIANRLHDGARLYTDGMHSPMPPLTYVLLRVMHPGGAIWIQESFLNYAFECASILLLYFVFARYVGVGLAFAACVGTIPIFLSFEKTILYDSMAHFLAALCAVLCALTVESASAGGNPPGRLKRSLAVLTGVTLGVLALTKQSTVVGTSTGICLTLAFLPAKLPLKKRCANIVLVFAIMAATLCGLALAMHKFVSFPGMLHDVFLAGTEPKGGPRRMFNNLARYSFSLFKIMAMAAVLFYGISLLLRRKLAWRSQAKDLETTLDYPIGAGAMSVSTQERAMLVAALTGLACVTALYWIPDAGRLAAIVKISLGFRLKVALLDLGLAASLALAGAVFIQGLRGSPGRWSTHPLAPFAIIFFTTAVFHNLSITILRWISDSNALIALALVFLLGVFFRAFQPGTVRQNRWALPGMAAVITCIVVMWAALFSTFKLDLSCTVPWPEVPHLAGAKLRPEADGLRQLVKTVQSLTDKDAHDTVLLLPDDPNVYAWLDRERPTLSSSIIFTDQYWDRYVDPDFASLKSKPPKVIIIGPKNFWRGFSRLWHWHKTEGLIRLVDRVENELLPAKYSLRVEQPIAFRGGTDYMEVYVLRDH